MSGNRFTHMLERQARLETRIDSLEQTIGQQRMDIVGLTEKVGTLVVQLERAKGGYAMLAGLVAITGTLSAVVTHVLSWKGHGQ